MPIYEYRCLDCGKTSTFLTLGVQVALELKCRSCGSASLRKLVSRVAVLRSEGSRLDGLDDVGDDEPGSEDRMIGEMAEDFGGGLESDPGSFMGGGGGPQDDSSDDGGELE
jgi:putative FmdB family regulatory protein